MNKTLEKSYISVVILSMIVIALCCCLCYWLRPYTEEERVIVNFIPTTRGLVII
jgi:hypothetical protein